MMLLVLFQFVFTSLCFSWFATLVLQPSFIFWQMPGTIMAMGRLNRPSIMVYGGTIKVT